MDWNPAHWYRDGEQYLTEVRSEFRKIVWPSQREYTSGTIGVVIIVAFLTLVLGLIDVFLAWGMEFIVR